MNIIHMKIWENYTHTDTHTHARNMCIESPNVRYAESQTKRQKSEERERERAIGNNNASSVCSHCTHLSKCIFSFCVCVRQQSFLRVYHITQPSTCTWIKLANPLEPNPNFFSTYNSPTIFLFAESMFTRIPTQNKIQRSSICNTSWINWFHYYWLQCMYSVHISLLYLSTSSIICSLHLFQSHPSSPMITLSLSLYFSLLFFSLSFSSVSNYSSLSLCLISKTKSKQ